MDREDDGDTGGKGDLAEDGVRERSGGVGESGMAMAENDGVAGGRGIIDGVGEDGGGIVDGVGGCGIGKAEDNGEVEGNDDGGVDEGAEGKAGEVDGLMCRPVGIEFAGVGA